MNTLDELRINNIEERLQTLEELQEAIRLEWLKAWKSLQEFKRKHNITYNRNKNRC